MNKTGQTAIEYLLIIAVAIILVIAIKIIIDDQNSRSEERDIQTEKCKNACNLIDSVYVYDGAGFAGFLGYKCECLKNWCVIGELRKLDLTCITTLKKLDNITG